MQRVARQQRAASIKALGLASRHRAADTVIKGFHDSKGYSTVGILYLYSYIYGTASEPGAGQAEARPVASVLWNKIPGFYIISLLNKTIKSRFYTK